MARYPDADDEYEAQFDQEPRSTTCKACGADGLTWHHTGVRFILIDEDARPHVCRPNSDDFEALA